MRKRRLTTAAVERLRPPATGRAEHFDAALPGFALRITERGIKSWVLFYRIGGRQRRLTIGRYPAIGLAQARDTAREAFQLVARGIDPAEEKIRDRERADTLEHVVREFIERHAKPNNRTWREAQLMFERHVLPRWGKRGVKTIDRRDVIELLDRVSDQTSAVRANRVLAGVSKLFNWAVDRGILEANPAARVRPPGKEVERDRVLSDDEIRAVWAACDHVGWPFGPFAQILLVTAQRRNEVAHMRWEDIDDEGVWSIPRELTKGDRAHQVPLPRLALDIIASVPRVGDYVFMSGRVEGRPISGFGKAKKRIDAVCGVAGWRLHDLRRTAGTNMARLGVPVSTISKVLNHAEGGVTRIYDRHSYLPEKREALERWSQELGKSVLRSDADIRISGQ